MSRRTREEIDQGRVDVLALLEEAGPLPEWHVVARVLGFQTVTALHEAWPQPVDPVFRDLQFLRRKGLLVDAWSVERHAWVWRLATLDDVDAEEDEREVARLMAGWVEVLS